jgi:phosphatidylinositol alpha-1,6-mannosyltransferase
MRLLFISRAHPPVVGGLERQNHALAEALKRGAEVLVIANRRGKSALPWFLPYAACRGLWLGRGCDVVLVGDGLLAPLGYLLGKCLGLPVVAIVHGLDLTWRNRLYQALAVRFALTRLAAVIAVSGATAAEAIARGVPESRVHVVANGVDLRRFQRGPDRQWLARRCGGLSAEAKVLLSVGRLIPRKGVAWFVEQVMTRLPEPFVLLVAGTGPERERIESTATARGLSNRVRLLGTVPEEELPVLYASCDLLVMPNVPIPGDMEGFGLVALEAVASGCGVVASDLEGVRQAVETLPNAALVPAEDAAGFTAAILSAASRGAAEQQSARAAATAALADCSWERRAQEYLAVLAAAAVPPPKPARAG